MPLDLSADKGLLFRITHLDNLPWLLANGLPSANSALRAPGFVQIGNADLIAKRTGRVVRLPPGGTLADYVPFYLTPKSPMLYNIKTGWKGIPRRPNAEIAILVATVAAMQAQGVRLLFTDRHAFMDTARWSADPAELATMIDWDILRRHDFQNTSTDLDKMDRYQAEALAHAHVPVAALVGIGCATGAERARIETMIAAAGLTLPVRARPEWYF